MDSNPRPIVGKLQARSPLSLSFTFRFQNIPKHSNVLIRPIGPGLHHLAEYQHKLGQNSVAPKTCQDMARATTGHETVNLSQPQRRIFQLGKGFRRCRCNDDAMTMQMQIAVSKLSAEGGWPILACGTV